MWKEASMLKQLDSSNRFDAIVACDGRTDGRTHGSKYRASIASRGKNITITKNLPENDIVVQRAEPGNAFSIVSPMSEIIPTITRIPDIRIKGCS